ncbi:MAG TPA: ABC transporter ATP-binding protein [Longimicrobiales bacterium]|nr:ABC transporter ATP-binding protein [Longimicrobiales bacterium]
MNGVVGDSPVVALRGLGRMFGSVPAVDGLTFDVARGELFGIVGPDGAGKTTTLRMLAGVLPPTAGDAEILGVSVGRDPEGVKPHLSYMAQRFGLYHDLTVRENLLFYADLYRVPREVRPDRLQRLYRFSRLGEFEDRLAGQLSGGMKQKLALSCALFHEPAVLLLDEPTFGVDPISRRELWLILHRMVADGMTIVMTTSYMDEAERCDRIALLDGGRVLALDRPARIQERLADRLLSVSADAPRAALNVLRRRDDVRRAMLFGDAVHVVVAPGVGPDVIRAALADAGVTATVQTARPSLEDAFMELVGGGSDG